MNIQENKNLVYSLSRLLDSIAQTIYDKKGCNILALDVRGISTLTDYLVIAEGAADKHVQAIANAVLSAMKDVGMYPIHIEGRTEGDWIVIDFLDIVVHLFAPGVRDHYRLETLWRGGKIVNVAIQIGKIA